MNGKTSRLQRDPRVTREELESLVARYRHVLEEHRRAGARSRSRRRLEHELELLSNRFERLLAHTPADEETLAGWRAHLHHAAPAPAEPTAGAPLLVRGRSQAAAAAAPVDTTPIEIVSRGRVSRRAALQLQEELERLVHLSPRPVLHIRGTLTHDENPSLARPVVVRATIDLGGRTLRARATAPGAAEAIDRLVERLRRALRDLRSRDETDRRPAGVAEPGHWRHGNLPPGPPKPEAEELGPLPGRSP